MSPGMNLHDFALRVLTVIGLVALALFLWRILDILLLVFGAGLVAIVLHAAAGPIRRYTRLGANAALAIAISGISLVIAAAVWLFGSELSGQATELLDRLPHAWTEVRQWLRGSELGRLALQHLDGSEPDLSQLAARLTGWLALASGVLLEVVLVAFGGIYLAATPSRYRNGLLKLLPPTARERVGATLDAAVRALRRWLLAQLVVMFAVGALTGLGLWLIGMPAPLALGVLAGLLEFVPYVGPIAAAVPGLLLALTAGPLMPLYAAMLYLGIQQVESNLVTPLVARSMLDLPPAFIVFSIVALGTVLGPAGWIFAVPLSVLLVVAVGRLYVRETLGTSVKMPGEAGG